MDGFSRFRAYPSPRNRWRRTPGLPSFPPALRDGPLQHVDPGIDLRHLLHLEGIIQDVPADAAEEPGGSRLEKVCFARPALRVPRRTGSRSLYVSLPGSGGWHASAYASGSLPWVIPPCGVGQWISGMLGPFAGSPTLLPVYYHKGNIIVKPFLHRPSPFKDMPLPDRSGPGQVPMDGVRKEVLTDPAKWISDVTDGRLLRMQSFKWQGADRRIGKDAELKATEKSDHFSDSFGP